MKRSFAELNAQEALHVAIFIEERNAEIYQRFAEMFTEFRDAESTQIAGVFWEMAVEERRHSTLLQSTYTERYGATDCAASEEDLVELLEVPRLEDSDIFSPDDGVSCPRTRALQVALDAELSAHRYYLKLMENTQEAPLRRLYGELAQMEDGHVAYLERKIAGATGDGLTIH